MFDRTELIGRVVESFNRHDDTDISTEELVKLVAKECKCTEDQVLEILAAGIGKRR